VEFLVDIEIRMPQDLPSEEVSRLYAAERSRGQALQAEGALLRIWRVPGTTHNVGLWSTQDADQLHAALASLPLYRWMTVSVRALATHPLEAPPHSA
jgi:muconolactone D-isomerase